MIAYAFFIEVTSPPTLLFFLANDVIATHFSSMEKILHFQEKLSANPILIFIQKKMFFFFKKLPDKNTGKF